MKSIDINPDQLRRDLIELYWKYIVKEEKEYLDLAKKTDGLWSGDFLFTKDIEEALNSITNMYTEPKLEKEKALEIYLDLKKEDEAKRNNNRS